MAEWSTVDLIMAAVIGFCGLLGLYWGLIRQVLSLVGLLAGLALATAHYLEVADLLSSLISNTTIAQALAFALIVISVNSAASLLASLIRRFVGLLFLGWLDHAIGALLGLVQGTVICTVVLLVMSLVPQAPWSAAVQQSKLAPVLVQSVGTLILGLLPATFQVASHTVGGGP